MPVLNFKNIAAKTFAAIVIVSQIFLIAAPLLTPKPARAFLGFADISFDFNTEIGNPYDIAKDIGVAALKRVAVNYANQYLTRFIDKMLDKYKIRNYLYYAKLLNSYYLNQYIANKIADPDLREMFRGASMLYSYDLQGDVGVTAAQKQATIKTIRDEQAKLYTAESGIDPNRIYNPDPSISDYDYFSEAYSYFSHPPSFTEIENYSDFSEIQGESDVAASQEIDAGDGLKTSRSEQVFTVTATGSPTLTKTLDIINNPAGYIRTNIDNAVNKIFGNNYDPNNPYSVIGNALGSFIFHQLQIDSNGSGDVISEFPNNFTTGDGSLSDYNDIDLDNDAIPDGQDVSGPGNAPDGRLQSPEDVCYHGGIASQIPASQNPADPAASGCKHSTLVSSSPYFAPLCQGFQTSIVQVQAFRDYADRHEDQLEDQDNFENKADASNWATRAQAASSSLGSLLTAIRNYHLEAFDDMEINMGRFANYMDAIFQSLSVNKDLELDDDWGEDDGVDQIIFNTTEYSSYMGLVLQTFGVNCDDPESEAGAVNQLPQPPVIGQPPGGGASYVPCDDPPDTISPDPTGTLNAVRADPAYASLDLTDESPGGQREQFLREVARRLNSGDPNWGMKASSAGAPVSSSDLGYLRPDIAPGRFEAVDVIVGGSQNFQRGCYGVVGSGQVWISP